MAAQKLVGMELGLPCGRFWMRSCNPGCSSIQPKSDLSLCKMVAEFGQAKGSEWSNLVSMNAKPRSETIQVCSSRGQPQNSNLLSLLGAPTHGG